jgi:hypothetical protein
MTSHHDNCPLRVLSIDSGDELGLSALLILKNIVERASIRQRPESNHSVAPCDMFDLICGTGTGGLIAVMLGRLRMDVDSAIQAYITITTALFKQKRQFEPGHGTYDHRILDDLVGKLVHAYRMGLVRRYGTQYDTDSVESMADSLKERSCKTFLLAISQAFTDAQPRLFRTYDHRLPADDCAIREAVRATMARSNFLDPIEIGNPPESFCVSYFH